ncbi:MAG: DUF5329 family protein [Thiohalomonadales bacterium]
MKIIFVILSLLLASAVVADVPRNQENEVKHLLNFIKNTNCTINRNGTDHSGQKGVKHIEKKYNYYRDDIKTTEDFIKYSATKSMLSGNYYTVQCPDKKTIKTQQWLLSELKRYRDKKATDDLKK